MKRRPISRQRAELRWLLVHEAGCVDCLATHDDELRGELASEGRVLGVRIPRSLRHLLVVSMLCSACGGQAIHLDWVLMHELGHAGGRGHVEGTCMSAADFEHPLPTSELCPNKPAQSWSVDTGLEPAFDSASSAWCGACGWCPTRASDGAEGVVMVEELPEPWLGSYTRSTNTIVVSIVLR